MLTIGDGNMTFTSIAMAKLPKVTRYGIQTFTVTLPKHQLSLRAVETQKLYGFETNSRSLPVSKVASISKSVHCLGTPLNLRGTWSL